MPSGTVLIVGASRGLGLALAQEYLARGWRVIATVRGAGRTQLHGLAEAAGEQLTVERVDITAATQVAALHERLAGTSVDLLFVNAGISNGDVSVMDVPTETFTDVMVTNALSPVRFVETFQDLVPPSGTIAVMSSRQGSLTLNTTAGYEVYRASKSALNQLMRSYAARHRDDPRTLLLTAPGWVNTDLGGPGASLTVDESIPRLVATIEAQRGHGGLQFLDYQGETVPW